MYLTASLSSLLGAAAATAREDVASGFRVSAVLSGLSPRAYELGTACVLVAANLSSAACLSFLTCFLGLFAWDSLAAIFLLAGAFAAGLAPLGFFLAAVFERRPLAVQQSAVTMMQIVAPLLYVPLAYFGAHSGAFFFFSFLFSPVAFAAAVDVATQAEAGRAPLTLANLASPTIGRDVRLGGDGGAHAMSAAAALGVLVLDAFAYAFAAWYVRRAREKGGDFWFAFRKRYWRGSKLFGDAFSDSDAKRHEVAVEMDDPSRGGRYEVIGFDEEDAEGETAEAEAEAEAEADEDGSQVADGPSRSTAAHLPSSARTGPPALAPAIQLERVCALADPPGGWASDGGGPVGTPSGGGGASFLPNPRAFFTSLLGGSPSRGAPGTHAVGFGGPPLGRRSRVVDGVTLSVSTGQCLALLGHSGSGASAILDVAAGRRPRSSGDVLFDGAPAPVDFSPADIGSSRKTVGARFANSRLEPLLTPREHAAFHAQLHRRRRNALSSDGEGAARGGSRGGSDRGALEALLRDAGFDDDATRDANVGDLDVGAQRALQVALAFVGAAIGDAEVDASGHDSGAASGPRSRNGSDDWFRHLVFLDDPTTDATDPGTRDATWGLIRRRWREPTTVVMATGSCAERRRS